MFRKMLICTDLSPASEILINSVEVLKSIGTQEVILAHVIHTAGVPGLEAVPPADARPILERQKEILVQQGVKVTVEMPFGQPAHALGEAADRHDVCAILAGSHGKRMVQTAPLGSVSAKLLHQTTRPLFLARTGSGPEQGNQAVCPKMFAGVLFPTDFSETAERALDYLGKIALETGCPATLLHVLGPEGDDSAAAREEEAWSLLEAKKRRLVTLGAAEVVIELIHGGPAEEIVTRTRRGDFSIVVMGCHGKGLSKELILGSTAGEVARHAGAPLLFIPSTS